MIDFLLHPKFFRYSGRNDIIYYSIVFNKHERHEICMAAKVIKLLYQAYDVLEFSAPKLWYKKCACQWGFPSDK